ncbi:hypothetical protein [Ascidiimonas aurantiaca]|uniref:hypothetical protein n=1 Tax=Ascidiimonas aurantiaca TaxID=1685432 RepID=UPI0030EDADFF
MITNTLFGVRICACTLFLVLKVMVVFPQVGIGTTTPDPSSVLDVTSVNNNTGVLLPRLTTSQRNAIVNPAQGLIIYNTDLNTLEYNSGTSASASWVRIMTSRETESVKYTSTNTTTDLSSNTNTFITVPIFGTLVWNDNISLFSNVSSTSIEITEAGRYRVSGVLYISGGRTDQIAVGVFVNGIQQSAPVASSESGSSFNTNILSSIGFSELLELSANDVISLRSRSTFENGTVRLVQFNSRNSFITIEKIN